MKHARTPINSALRRDLFYNPGTQLYEIKENKITYGMPLEMTRSLNEFVGRGNDHSSEEGVIASWYNSLYRSDKMKVIREGDVEDSEEYTYNDWAGGIMNL